MGKRVGLFAISVLTMAAVPLLATTIPAGNTYSSLASWQTAVGTGNATDLTFNATTVPNGTKTPFTLGDFTFSGTGMTEENQQFEASTIHIASSIPVSAVLLWIDTPGGSGGSFSLTLSDGETSGSVPISMNTYHQYAVYYGFKGSTGITSIDVTGAGIGVGDLWYSTAGLTQPPPKRPDPTPEAATSLLMSGGLLLLFSTGRKLPPRNAV